MQTSMDEAQLKALLKSAIVEVFEERRDFLRDLIADALEDIALARAIEEGENSESVTRDEVFKLFEVEA